MKPKLVRFKDGTCGIRRWSWYWMCYEYLDLKRGDWRPLSSVLFDNCKGTIDTCRKMILESPDKGTVIK